MGESRQQRARSGDKERERTHYRRLTPLEAFEQITIALRKGVPIVPLVGAGLSVESGIPTTEMLIDYFAKVKTMIDVKRRRSLNQKGQNADGPSAESASLSIYHDYLLEAGWPDLHLLNTELLTVYHNDPSSLANWTHEKSSNSFQKQFAEPAGNPLGGVRLQVINDYLQREQPALTGVFTTQTPHEGCPKGGAFEAMEDALIEVIKQYQHHKPDHRSVRSNAMVGPPETAGTRIDASEQRDGPSTELTIVGRLNNLRASALRKLRVDWRALMRMLTLGNPALADSLFDQLVRNGLPSPGYQILALLTESLRWNLWLTTNFDTRIEQSLRADDRPCRLRIARKRTDSRCESFR